MSLQRTPPILPLSSPHSSSPTPGTTAHLYSPLPRRIDTPTTERSHYTDFSLLHTAVVDLTNIIRSAHENNSQMMCNIREDFSSAISWLFIVVKYWQRLLPVLHKKRKTNATEIEVTRGHTHDWVEAEISRNLLDYMKSENIFPSTSPVSS